MHSIKIKIKGAEFEASGDPKLVSEQYADFMKLAAGLPDPEAPTEAPKKASDGKQAAPPGAGGDVDLQALMARVFSTEGDVISLNILPSGDAAALSTVLLLLYGHAQLAGKPTVMVDSLLKGMSQSGAQHGTNIARIVSGTPGLVTKAGVKRGTKYGLTNKGKQQAEETLRGLI